MINETALLSLLAIFVLISLALGVIVIKLRTNSGAPALRAEYAEQQNQQLTAQNLQLQQQNAQQSEELHALQVLRSREEAQLDAVTDQLEQSQHNLAELNQRYTTLQQTLSQTERALSSHQSMQQELKQRLDDKQAEYLRLDEQYRQLNQQFLEINREHTRLTTELSQKESHFKEQMQLLEESRALLKRDFENLANEILEQKGKRFTELSQTSLSALLNPIQAEMKGFKEKVEHIHEQESMQRVQLRTELENLQKLNRDITEQAQQLTSALQGQKKTQGNWGELILENVLDKSGLRLGDDYLREVSFNTAEGRQRPDALVKLPHEKNLIIDAKTSLLAYTRYVNAETEPERLLALKEHAKAVSDRIDELADRNYYQLPGVHSPEIVIMFIPIESAYVAALKYDDTLYQRAIEKKVLVATPTTLLTSLNIVRQLWRFEDQNKHTAELANRAEKFYQKLSSFLHSMQDVGKKLDAAKGSYDRALSQLADGRGNLIKQANEFKELGVAVNKALPDEFTERANLELDIHTDNQMS